MEMIWLRLCYSMRIASKSHTEFSPLIDTFMELRCNAILPRLINLALNLYILMQFNAP